MFQHTSTRHCRCSTRALESLIFDLAGLRLSSSSSSQSRWASSSFAAGQLSVTAGNCASRRTFASQRSSSVKGSYQTRERQQDRPSNFRGKPPMKSNQSWPPTKSRGDGPRVRGKMSTRPIIKSWEPTKSRGDDRRRFTPNSKPTKFEAPKTVIEPGRSVEKDLSRLLRKQRRIEAGKFPTRTEPEGAPSPEKTTPEVVSEGMRSRIKDKVEVALHKVGRKNAGVAAREEESLGRQQRPVRRREEQLGEAEIHDEGVDETIAESTDGVGESHDSVLERIEGLSDSNEANPTTPSLLFGMEGEMPNPNQKFAKDKPLPPAPPYKPKAKEPWQIQKAALQEKFGVLNWDPSKRLSPDSLNGIRALHASDPGTYSTEVLATNFQISAEGIRRILKSKWRPSEDEARDRLERWERRGARKWEAMASDGMRPPRRWRAQGIQQRGVAESRLRPSPTTQRAPRMKEERNAPGGVRVHKSMEGVITQKMDRHGGLLALAAARTTMAGAAPGGAAAEGRSVKGGFAGRIV